MAPCTPRELTLMVLGERDLYKCVVKRDSQPRVPTRNAYPEQGARCCGSEASPFLPLHLPGISCPVRLAEQSPLLQSGSTSQDWGPCDHKEDRGCFSGLAGDVRPLVMSEQRVPPLFFFFIESPSLILMEHVKWLVTSTCQEGHNRGYPPLRDESEGSDKNETACMRRPAKSGHALHKA